MFSKSKRFFLLVLLLVFSLNTSASTRIEVGDWDIDDDGRADALTDGLLFLRYAFELRGDALISGLISSSSEYTTASDIERELALVYDASGDIDGDGNVDALTDGLLLLRYLFGLSGETLTVGVVANGATRTSSSDLEGFIGNLMPSAPYITLLGSAVLDHEQATDYVDAGATAMDYADGSVAVSVSGSVNSGVAGVYVLTYTAVDSEGNTAKPLTRTVTVADTTAPVITLLGESTVEVDQNASYTDAGATATDAVDGDNIDGDVELVKTGSVDTTAAGTYTITYTATDTSNNSASVSRTVGVLGPKTRILNVFTNSAVDPTWDEGFNGADSGISWGNCNNDGGEGCPNIAWELVDDPDRGQVIQIEHSSAGQHAIFYIKTSDPQNLSVYKGGQIKFDIKTISGDSNYTMKIDCVYPCTSGDRSLGTMGQNGWEEISINVDDLVDAGLSLVSIDTGIVIWASQYTDTVFQIDNIRWEDTDGGEEPEDPVGGDDGWVVPDYSGYASPTTYDGYELVWSDDFNDSEINTDNWGFDIGGSGWGNNESQFYTNRNAYTKDGMLIIRAEEEDYAGNSYTSTRLKTQGKQNFVYGRIDIRARLPEGQGIWPALWMLGKNFSEVSWPKSGEIDIMEMIGGNNRERTVHGTAHWNNGGINADYSPAYYGGSKTKTDGNTLADQFHVFSIVWTSDSIIWYLDNVQYHIMALNNSADLAPFRKEFFFIFNVAVGGNWPGYPNNSTVFPQRMVVDYVRVFQEN